AQAQGSYQYSQFLGGGTSSLAGCCGQPNGSYGSLTGITLPGLITRNNVTLVQFYMINQFTFYQVGTNKSLISSSTFSVNFSSTNVLYGNGTNIACCTYVSSATSSSIGNSVFGTSCHTYFWLSGAQSQFINTTANAFVNDVAFGTGNYGNISG